MRRALEAQQIQDRLPRRLGEGVRVASKTGSFTDVIHDAGLVTWPGGTLVIAVLPPGCAAGVAGDGRHRAEPVSFQGLSEAPPFRL
jgi:beta-lactamase class A